MQEAAVSVHDIYCLFKKLLACVLHNVGMFVSEDVTQIERFWLDY